MQVATCTDLNTAVANINANIAALAKAGSVLPASVAANGGSPFFFLNGVLNVWSPAVNGWVAVGPTSSGGGGGGGSTTIDPCTGASPAIDQNWIVAQMTNGNAQRWGTAYSSAEPSEGGNPWAASLFATGGASMLFIQNRANAYGFNMNFLQRCNAIAPGIHLVAGEGHASTNTQVALRKLGSGIFRNDTNSWVKLGETRPTGQLDRWAPRFAGDAGYRYGADDELPAGSNMLLRAAPNCSSTVTLTAPGAPYDSEFYAIMPLGTPLSNVGNFICWAEAKLVLIDPNGPDDRAQSRFAINAWMDLYDTVLQANGGPRYYTQTGTTGAAAGFTCDVVPGYAFDGARSSVQRVGNDWQRYVVVGVDPFKKGGMSCPYQIPEYTATNPASLTQANGGYAWSAAQYLANPFTLF